MTMNSDKNTFRSLPLSAEQDAEIRAYIKQCEDDGIPWDTLALDYILKDMLNPSPSDDRIDFCDEYARELASRTCRTGEELGSDEQKFHALSNGLCAESEWHWIVREAKMLIPR
jgi:hypothetical protein